MNFKYPPGAMNAHSLLYVSYQMSLILQGSLFFASVATAFVSATWIKVAAAPVPDNWWEASPYIIFIASLGYAVAKLWTALRNLEKQRAKNDRETIERQSAANKELAQALDRLSKKDESKS